VCSLLACERDCDRVRPMNALNLRVATPSDDDQIREVVRAAFGDEGETIVRILGDLEIGGLTRASIVAEADGQIVGHVGLSHAWLDTRQGPRDVWLLSPLSTVPSRERQGIGTALIAQALTFAEAGGVPLVFLEGSPDFYGARGFESAAALGFRPPSLRIPKAAFQVAVLPAWDEAVGTLVYPDVWWRHGAVGLQDPLLADQEERYGSWHE
jgi:putative acetyltransferase